MTNKQMQSADEFIASVEAQAKAIEQGNNALREELNTSRASTNLLLASADAALNETLKEFEDAEPQVITENDIAQEPNT